jgi:hypothetical protein
MEKIDYDNMRTVHIKNERSKLSESRFQVRREADRQKKTILDVFENMKKRGRIDN